MKSTNRWSKRGRFVLVGLLWAYLFLILGIWFVLWAAADRWWLATVCLFGPRWLFVAPLPFLAVAAAVFWHRGLWLMLVAAIVLLIPVLGFCMPWGRLWGTSDGIPLRVMTYNVNENSVKIETFAQLLAQNVPDVVALQELNAESEFKWPDGWCVRRAGDLLIASRYPISQVDTLSFSHPLRPWQTTDALRCILETPAGPIAVCCVHLHTPRGGLSEVLDRNTVISPKRSGTLAAEIDFRHREAEHVAQWLSRFSEPLVIAGDFNMPADSRIYREFFSTYRNAFSSGGFGFGYTKWTPVHGWSYGTRIDHILTNSHWQVRRSWVGPNAGSDHLPLLADLVEQVIAPKYVPKAK
jgi:vancomycin resistance protein VanJ